jgi:hypothetical protein
MPARVVVEVELALGPGVDFEREPYGGLVGRRARRGGMWLGFDRAAVVDSDDGSGRRLAILVALPSSTYVGCRLEVELAGGWQTADGSILVGYVPGSPRPPPPLARVAANLNDGAWIDARAAERIARRARQRDRERRSHARIRGGRAWHAIGVLPPELARFATPHSAAEYRLATVPPRFVRGLEGLLDDDERLLYWVERPTIADVGLLRRLRRGLDRRAALLALTDRQLLWIVDHVQPDQYLSDWGIDIELVPVERVVAVSCEQRAGVVELTVTTPAGPRAFGLPPELTDEVRLMRDLIARFTPSAAGDLPRRSYALEPIPFDAEAAARFGQEAEARAMHDRAASTGEILGFLFSPVRPGQRLPAALVLRPAAAELLGSDRPRRAALADVAAINVTLSPLLGRIAFGRDLEVTYPAPVMDRGAAFVRLARHALAMIG